MVTQMRQSTLQTLGLGTVLEIFQRGQLPTNSSDLVDQIFGTSNDRGSLVISGANGIVGAGKAMQLGTRLLPYGVSLVALDMGGSPDGIGKQYEGLVSAFGPKQANKIIENIIRLTYDGTKLPPELKVFKPRFLLEAIPEILSIKKSHFEIFKKTFPDIEIRSVTSGFPRSELGVGIAHPAFPHEINKIFEIVEPEPSPITKLLWSLGLIPVQVSDHWAFVLDVLFCGLTLAGLRYHRASNMPFWKIDKFIRKFLGPNPFRAHDAIGAKGANFLTWSCLHHLSKVYGDLFTPTPELVDHKDTGMNWYPMNHFRPLVNWSMTQEDDEAFRAWILGPLCQMTSLMLHEKRSHLSIMNSIGELCAQFSKGILAVIRDMGYEKTIKTVELYHTLHPEAAQKSWHPEVFQQIDEPEWQQLYVNAEHDGKVGVITLSRESYNSDVNAELNRAVDWLKNAGIKRVIITGDFHLSTQLVGADTDEFFPALENVEIGNHIATSWSKTARRLYNEFEISVGFVNGKRCLGGMLELLMHCHYLVSLDDAALGMPEVTLPVVPGMEGCHWPLRKATPEQRPKLVKMLLEGRSLKATDTVGWLTDFVGPLDEALQTIWKIMTDGNHGLSMRKVDEGSLEQLPLEISGLTPQDPATEKARKAIFESIKNSCESTLADAIAVQAKHSANFMTTPYCQKGSIGAEYQKKMKV